MTLSPQIVQKGHFLLNKDNNIYKGIVTLQQKTYK